MVGVRMNISHLRGELYLCGSNFLGSQHGPPNNKTGHTLGFVTTAQIVLVKLNVGDGPGQ